MGQAKNKQRAAFAQELINDWEADDCVNFSVALARLTGWILHVDWWSTSTEHQEDIPVGQLKPLRVYVGDNRDRVFDVRGVKTIFEFTEKTIHRLAMSIGSGSGGVYTRFYGETKLSSLPLRSQPDEAKISSATAAIRENQYYLAAIPKRTAPFIPAHEAAVFTFGRCAAYAEAMRELTGLQPVALLAVKFSPSFERTKSAENGYFHSVVLHPDGLGEDSWGKAPLAEIASRFGVIQFEVSGVEHLDVIKRIKRSSADIYEDALKEARVLIQTYRLPHS